MMLDHGNNRCLIESSGRPLGIVVHEGAGWIFHAAAPGVWNLDGRIFETVRDAEIAVKNLLREESTPRKL